MKQINLLNSLGQEIIEITDDEALDKKNLEHQHHKT